MKKISLILGSMLLVSTIGASSAMANLVSLQAILDNRTSDGSSSVNVTTDALASELDDYWQINAPSVGSATMIVELAGFAATNVFGVYDRANTDNRVTLFDGPAAANNLGTPWDTAKTAKTIFEIYADGSVWLNTNTDTGKVFSSGNNFGFFLDSRAGTTDNGGGLFFSDTTQNTDGLDHMLAFAGKGDMFRATLANNTPAAPWLADSYVLAWEDLFNNGDSDFDDIVVMVQGVSPVPEPATMLLFGTGLVGLAGFGSRRRSRNNA